MKVGFYEKDITPPLGVDIPGYFNRRLASEVKSGLYAKASVVEVDGEYVAFLVTDSLYIPRGLPEYVKKTVSEKTPITGERIFIGATHSHTSIPIDRPSDNSENKEINQHALQNAIYSAADAVVLAYKRLEEAEVFFGKSSVEGVSFIRQYLTEDGEIRTNPYYCRDKIVKSIGTPDTELPVAIFKRPDGTPLGSITSLSLHHDTANFNRTWLSGDYSGLVADALKKEYSDKFVSLFFAGFCGDINHLNYLPGARLVTPQDEIGEVVTKAYLDAVGKAERVEANVLSVNVEKVQIKKRKFDDKIRERLLYLIENPPEEQTGHISQPYCDGMLYASRNTILNWYINNDKENYETQSMAVRIGDILISGISGEVFSKFVYDIRNASPTDKNICCAYSQSDIVTCYMPPKDMHLPLVYESSYYSARFAPGTGEAETESVIRMGKKCFE